MRGEEDLQVVVAGDVVGGVRLAERDGELVVLGAQLTSPGHAAVLGSLLRCRALAGSAAAVVLDGDEGALGDLVGAGGWEVASQRMRLDLDGDLPAEPAVRLAPMGEESFAAFRDRLEDDYVRERTGSGETPEVARRTMTEQLGALLPDGPASPEQHLFTGWVGGTAVGHLWLGTERPGAFVYLVEVAPEERRRGHGAGLMRAGALWAREQGRDHVALNVFGHNTAARALYAALGYRVTGTTYRRPLAAW